MGLKCFMLLCFVGCSLAEISKENLVKTCKVGDLECVKQSTQLFLGHTAGGIPEYDIKPIDPLIIESLTYDLDAGVVHKLQNVTITGLKDLTVTDFKMSKEAELSMTLDIVANCDLQIEFSKEKKSFETFYTLRGQVKTVATYPYKVIEKDGDEYFEMGAIKYDYQINETPTYEIRETTLKEMKNDIDLTDTVNTVASNKDENAKKSLLKVAEKVVPFLMDNMKRASDLLPKNKFFSE